MDSPKMVPTLLLLLLLVTATEMGSVTKTEARFCDSQSHRYKGPCIRSSNCENVCHNEGFPHGVCMTQKFERKCFCRKIC